MTHRKLSEGGTWIQPSDELKKQIADAEKRREDLVEKIEAIKKKETIITQLIKNFLTSKKREIKVFKFAFEFNRWFYKNSQSEGLTQFLLETLICTEWHSTKLTYAIDEKKAYVTREHFALVTSPAIEFDIEKNPCALELLDEGLSDAEIPKWKLDGMSKEEIQTLWKKKMEECFHRYKLAKKEEAEETDEVLE